MADHGQGYLFDGNEGGRRSKLIPCAKIEVNLPNIGWMPGEVVRLEGQNAIGIRFSAVVDPARTLVPVSGSYRAAPVSQTQLLRV